MSDQEGMMLLLLLMMMMMMMMLMMSDGRTGLKLVAALLHHRAELGPCQRGSQKRAAAQLSGHYVDL